MAKIAPWIEKLPVEERSIWEAYLSSATGAYGFLTGAVWTKDPASKDSPVRKFPELDYLKELVRDVWEEPLVAIEKSRRMVISWTVSALYLLDALGFEGRTLFVASKKLDGSEELLGRCKFIYEHLPPWIPKPPMRAPAARQSKDPDAVNALIFRHGSYIQAVAEGSDQLRQYGASRIDCDEFAFWQWPRSAWAALRPTIEGGGQIALISTPNPSFMEAIVHDQL